MGACLLGGDGGICFSLTKVLCTEIWIEVRKFSDCLGLPQVDQF